MAEPEATHAYVIYAACGCPNVLIADTGRPISLGKDENIPEGGRMERVTIREARALGAKMYGCPACQAEADSE